MVFRVQSGGPAQVGGSGWIHAKRKTGFSGWASSFLLSVIQTVYRHICLYSVTKKACGKKRHTCVTILFTLQI